MRACGNNFPRMSSTFCVPVPAKRLPFFKVGKELKELVNESRSFAITGGDDHDDDDGDQDDDE